MSFADLMAGKLPPINIPCAIHVARIAYPKSKPDEPVELAVTMVLGTPVCLHHARELVEKLDEWPGGGAYTARTARR